VDEIELSDNRLLVRFNIGLGVLPNFTRGSCVCRIGLLALGVFGIIIFNVFALGDFGGVFALGDRGGVFALGDFGGVFALGDLGGVFALGITFGGLLRIVGNGVFISSSFIGLGLHSGVGDLSLDFFFGGDFFFVVFSLFNIHNDTPEIIVIPLNNIKLSTLDIYYTTKKILLYRSNAKYFSFNSSVNSS
jgi:hypothetical protein